MSPSYDCVVCLETIKPSVDGTLRIEGINTGSGEWAWGPYPVHEPCRLNIITGYEWLVAEGTHVARGFRAAAHDPDTVALLENWARLSPNSVAKQWPGHWSRATPPLPLPWPELTNLVDLRYRHLVGLIAPRGSHEATAGTVIAVHAAVSGKQVLLFTSYPPRLSPPSLRIDTSAHPTPERVRASMRRLRPDLVVIERWERMHSERIRAKPDEEWEEQDESRPLSRAAALDAIGGDLKRAVCQNDVPTLVTLSVTQEIELERPRLGWAGRDSPASIMTEFCEPLLALKRHSTTEVQARLERHGSMPEDTMHTVAWKA